jgi:4'-phosphopantetheinyl transferase
MPLILNHSNIYDHVALWRITDEEFNDRLPLLKQNNSLSEKQNQRIRQRRACLELVSVYAGRGKEIYYDSHGKPHLSEDNRKISFSHSGEYAAMMLSDQFAGIDFELIRPKVLNIIHKFLNPPELESILPDHAAEHAHVYWGAKEALYKVYGKQQLIFKEHILLTPFIYKEPKGHFYARIETDDFKKEFKLYYEKMFGFMLVYIVNDPAD